MRPHLSRGLTKGVGRHRPCFEGIANEVRSIKNRGIQHTWGIQVIRREILSALEVEKSTEPPASNHGVPTTAQAICISPAVAEWEFPGSRARPGPGPYRA